eukprot:8779289-Pyramimonas_sp.AAC.1
MVLLLEVQLWHCRRHDPSGSRALGHGAAWRAAQATRVDDAGSAATVNSTGARGQTYSAAAAAVDRP